MVEQIPENGIEQVDIVSEDDNVVTTTSRVQMRAECLTIRMVQMILIDF